MDLRLPELSKVVKPEPELMMNNPPNGYYDPRSANVFTNFGIQQVLQTSANMSTDDMQIDNLRPILDPLTQKELYACPICNRMYKSRASLKQHYVNHSMENKFMWDVGKNDYFKREDMTNNMLPHARERKAFHCGTCDEGYDSYEFFMRHILSHDHSLNPQAAEPNNSVEDLICKFCQKSFKNRCKYERHLKTHARKFPCSVCKKSFQTKEQLTSHEERHRNWPFANMAILQSPLDNVRARLDPETKKKIFDCPSCEQNFESRFNLSLHFRVHVGRTPFKCNMCSRAFHDKNGLKTHLMTYNHKWDALYLQNDQQNPETAVSGKSAMTTEQHHMK